MFAPEHEAASALETVSDVVLIAAAVVGQDTATCT